MTAVADPSPLLPTRHPLLEAFPLDTATKALLCGLGQFDGEPLRPLRLPRGSAGRPTCNCCALALPTHVSPLEVYPLETANLAMLCGLGMCLGGAPGLWLIAKGARWLLLGWYQQASEGAVGWLSCPRLMPQPHPVSLMGGLQDHHAYGLLALGQLTHAAAQPLPSLYALSAGQHRAPAQDAPKVRQDPPGGAKDRRKKRPTAQDPSPLLPTRHPPLEAFPLDTATKALLCGLGQFDGEPLRPLRLPRGSAGRPTCNCCALALPTHVSPLEVYPLETANLAMLCGLGMCLGGAPGLWLIAKGAWCCDLAGRRATGFG